VLGADIEDLLGVKGTTMITKAERASLDAWPP
jgi:hypothetical protein